MEKINSVQINISSNWKNKDEIMNNIKDVKQKAEEFENAIQRLSESKLEIEFTCNKLT